MKKILLIGLAAVAVLVVVGLVVLYFSLNTIVKSGVETVGPMATKTTVTVEKVSLSPFSGAGGLKGIVVGNPEGFKTESAFKLGDVHANVALSSLLSDKIVVQEVVIDGPEITYEAGLSGSNIGKIQANVEAFAGSMTTGGSGATQPTAPASPQKKVQINKFVLRNGRVSVSAKLLGGKALTLPLPPIELTDIGTGPEGATVGEVMKKVLGAVGDGVKDAVKKGGEVIGKGAEKLGDAAKDAGENVKEGGKKALDKIKGTFQKD